MMKGSKMRYTKIFASGALAKFLNARYLGASHPELMRLKTAAEAEVMPSRPGSKRREPSAGLAVPGKLPKNRLAENPISHRSNVLDFIDRAKFDRAQIERSWESAPEAS